MSNTAGMGPMHVGTPMQLTHSAGPVANAVEIQDGNDNWVALPNPNNLQQYQADAAAYQIVAADNAAHAAQLNYDASHSSSLATRINDSALATADSNTAYAQTAEA
ncbi:MAG TPA: hypothetical protein VFN51_01320, partial [Candidatus Saccharimonadales bacterium]|nr:hypothetical protein [Candidatus Saccharimonadales bacterium]